MASQISEGKTLEPQTLGAQNIDSQPCGGCEIEDSTHYCTHCTIGLCTKCERIHRKGKLYQNHHIVSIIDTSDDVNLISDITIPHSKAPKYSVSECKHTDGDTVVLFSREDDREVRVFNTKNRSFDTFTCDIIISSMASLSTNRHAIHGFRLDGRSDIHLLNERFQIISTLQNKDVYQPQGVCSESASSFILLEKSLGFASSKRRLSRVYTHGDKLVKFILSGLDLDLPYVNMSFHKDYNAVLLPNSKSLISMVNLKTMKPVTYDYSAYNPMDRWYAMDRTNDRILIIDENKSVLLFDISGAYKGEFDTCGAVVGGVALRGSMLILSVNKGNAKRILLYNVDLK